MKALVFVMAFAMATAALANDWEKFYKPIATPPTIPSSAPAELAVSSGNLDSDLEAMWRRGYAPIGYSSFNASNSKTSDAVKLANKLHAKYVIVTTQLTSSNTSSIPTTAPTTTTSYTTGTASAVGSGGYASGNYNGTTTTYGSQTSYIPITVNHFDKAGIYFQEVPKKGTGIYPRELTTAETAQLDTRRAFAVRFVRDGSPAYNADIMPNDIVLNVNGKPADPETWKAEISKPGKVTLHLIRRGQTRDITVFIPPEWATT